MSDDTAVTTRTKLIRCLLLSSIPLGILSLFSAASRVSDFGSFGGAKLVTPTETSRSTTQQQDSAKKRMPDLPEKSLTFVSDDSKNLLNLRELQELELQQETRAAASHTGKKKPGPTAAGAGRSADGGRKEEGGEEDGACANGTCPSIVSLARSKGLRRGGTLPLVFANSQYWPVLLNNLAAIARVDRNLPAEVGVVCLDNEVVLLLAEAGAPPCYLISDDDDDKNSDNNHALQLTLLRANGDGAAMAELWERRVVELNLLLSAGFGALCFDVDAVWQTDVRKLIGAVYAPGGVVAGGGKSKISNLDSAAKRRNRRALLVARVSNHDRGFVNGGAGVSGGGGSWTYSYDVVASRGSFPNEVGKKWGATLCMGLIYFAPTAGARRLVSHMMSSIDKAKRTKAEAIARGKKDPGFDDQISINRALANDARLVWGVAAAATTSNKSSSTTTRSGTIIPTARRLLATSSETTAVHSSGNNNLTIQPSKESEGILERRMARQSYQSHHRSRTRRRLLNYTSDLVLTRQDFSGANDGRKEEIQERIRERARRRLRTRAIQKRVRRSVQDVGAANNCTLAAATTTTTSSAATATTMATNITSAHGDAQSSRRMTRRGPIRGRERQRGATIGASSHQTQSSRGGGGGGLPPLTYLGSGGGGRQGLDVGRGSLGGIDVSVGLLTHAMVVRRCDKETAHTLKRASVLHCYSHKTASGKIEAGRRYGSWVLPQGWNITAITTAAAAPATREWDIERSWSVLGDGRQTTQAKLLTRSKGFLDWLQKLIELKR